MQRRTYEGGEEGF